MVGTNKLMKLMHYKYLKIKVLQSSTKDNISSFKRTNESGAETSRDADLNGNVKVEASNNLCRVCLRVGKIPIFTNNTAENIANSLCIIGGIELSIHDPYPKNICNACHALLQGALLLRKNAQQSDELLKKQKNSPKLVKENSRNQAAVNNNYKASNNLRHTENYANKKPIEVSNKEINEDLSELDVHDDNDASDNILSDMIDKIQVNVDPVPYTKNDHSCKKCNLKFNSVKEYNEHRYTEEHLNKKEPCSICKNLYVSQYLKRHMNICHSKKVSAMCDVCGKNFYFKGTLNRHRLTHFYDLPIKCSLCPYRGRFPESLKSHMKSHTGEKAYQCDECSARFINKSNLSKHMKTHTKIFDFSCEVCGKGIHTRAELKKHIKVIHRGILEHICKICNKAFGYSKQLRKHEIKVHKRNKLRPGVTPLYLQVDTMKEQGTHET